jgi:glyoxylase-like metal-dependent hydrolase (beta-lactamase superfamily II)
MRTKLFTAIAAGLLMTGTATAEETIPLNAVNKANEVIDAAIEAYGGAEAITNLNSVSRKNKFTTWATNQSLKPGAPWDEGETLNFQAINFENEQYRALNAGSGGGFDFENGQLINGENSYNFDYRGGTMTEVPAPDFNTTSGPLIRVTAPLLVKQLQNRRQTSHWLGEVDFEGRKHDVVTLVMEVGPALSLYFDQETHLLTRSERVLPPFGQVDYRFKDYVTIDGIPFSKRLDLFANDQPNLIIDRYETVVNPNFEQFVALPEGLEVLEAAPVIPPEIALQEIEEGVFLVGAGGAYGLFVEMGDYIVAVGGTAGAAARIAEVRKVIADKPIRYGVLTHHHNDHLVSVPDYEAEGAIVVTVRENEEVVRGTATEGDALKLRYVEESEWLHGTSRKIQLIDIGPTPHVEHLIVAWLPEEGILFEADHFPNPGNGKFAPAQPVTRRLAEVIAERGMDVKIIVGAHTPWQARMADLNSALNLKPKKMVAAVSAESHEADSSE